MPIARLMAATALIAFALAIFRDLTIWWACRYYMLDLALLTAALLGTLVVERRLKAACLGFTLATCIYWPAVFLLPRSLWFENPSPLSFAPPSPPTEQVRYALGGMGLGLAGALAGGMLAHWRIRAKRSRLAQARHQ
jgi:hypothetical protein